jgi:hypothetical protein
MVSKLLVRANTETLPKIDRFRFCEVIDDIKHVSQGPCGILSKVDVSYPASFASERERPWIWMFQYMATSLISEHLKARIV